MEKILDRLPKYNDSGNFETFDCNNGSFMVRIISTNQAEYNDYLSKLADAGFVLYDSNCIRDNFFATYINDAIKVHVYFTAHDGIARIIADKNLTLHNIKPELVNKKCDTTLYQFELDYRNIDCGMCYVVQCPDFSFFIIDSAHMNSAEDHNRLYNFLRKLTPGGQDIEISGWFFSHAHQDHIFMFMSFLEAGFKDCRIERLYYNLPALTVPGSESWSDSDKQTMREFNELIDRRQDIPVVKLHTGQKFFVRNLEFDVLATHEDMYPNRLDRYNDSCAVIMMRVDNCKTLFLGDACAEESTILVARYGAYLKSDIVQVGHHGYDSGNAGVYYSINAETALYPNKQEAYDGVKDNHSNRVISKLSKEIYIAGNGTAALKLPYASNTAVVSPKEIND